MSRHTARTPIRTCPTSTHRRRSPLGRAALLLVRAADAAAAEHPRTASGLCRQALTLAPHLYEGWCLMARLAESAGRVDDAVRAYGHAIDLEPDAPDALFRLGSLLRREGRFDEALQPLRIAVRLRPSHGPSQTELGLVLLHLGGTEDAAYWLGCAAGTDRRARRLLRHLEQRAA